MSAFIEFQNEVLKSKKPCNFYFEDKFEDFKVRAYYDENGNETFFTKFGNTSETEKTMAQSKLLTDTLLEQNRISKLQYEDSILKKPQSRGL